MAELTEMVEIFVNHRLATNKDEVKMLLYERFLWEMLPVTLTVELDAGHPGHWLVKLALVDFLRLPRPELTRGRLINICANLRHGV